ncbi:MAG TPA: VWA domain-containing protein [Leptospiraceae bacterium]|nr:VWA domain-containing protein [Leptospiraceae bacterium]HMX34161.1 VWA domain-containing protein [Leptospiraceae bacterium]HMY30254.1 VWA domain-containing protein [Leptospiraceae bacterium]HMZ66141.1 VWA domain-containing protein [Leptospiraceae bacterium]HNA07167.1 VWA domain-containing protein [Leptospiraceae bacterium]
MTKQKIPLESLEKLKLKWLSFWPEAIEIWSKYLKLSDPRFCLTKEEENKEHLLSSFAMIRLDDHAVVISLRQVAQYELEDYPLEIMCHEIGHHIYCPADLTDHGRLIARIRRAIPGYESEAPLIANLYGDLLINDKLKREHGLRLDDVYKKIGGDSVDKMWTFYLRIYEILWGLTKNTLAKGEITSIMEGDAQLGNRIIRNFSNDWLEGAGRFASLCYPYLVEEGTSKIRSIMSPLLDSQETGSGSTFPSGLSEIEEGELSGAKHPSLDGEIKENNAGEDHTKVGNAAGQYREPFEYGAILKALGLTMSQEEITIQYYKERSMPYLIPFPTKETPVSKEPLMEGLDIWDIGSPFENIDWFQTAMRSPVVIPGFTTVEQIFGVSEGSLPEKEPVDLDIYIDCSGSMPNPGYNISYLALAGTIITLSALRVGSRVQATLWSGPKEFYTTNGFISDEKELLKVVTGYLGGSTAFPIHILRETYTDRKPNARKVHILVISDEGVTTMFDKDEKKNSGWDISEMSLKNCGGGGTFVLNLYSDWQTDKSLVRANQQGWDMHRVNDWEALVKFAKEFSNKKYGSEANG